VAVTVQSLNEQADSVCDTLPASAFHMSLVTKYGLRSQVPNWADVVNSGLAHAPPPAEGGAGVGLAGGDVGDGDADGVGDPVVGEDVPGDDGDGDGDGDAEWLALDRARLLAAEARAVTYAGRKACVGCAAGSGMAVASPSAWPGRTSETTAPAFSATAAAGVACQPPESR
jgi:hypothetical protein